MRASKLATALGRQATASVVSRSNAGAALPQWRYRQKPLIDSTNRHTEPWGRRRKDGDTWTDQLSVEQAHARVREACKSVEHTYEILPIASMWRTPLLETDDSEGSRFWNEDGTIKQKRLRMSHASVEAHNRAVQAFRDRAEELGWDVFEVEVIRHGETAHNLSKEIFPELEAQGLEYYTLAYHDTEITTPENRPLFRGQEDPPGLLNDGVSQLQRLGTLRSEMAKDGFRIPELKFVSSHVRTGQSLQVLFDTWTRQDRLSKGWSDSDACSSVTDHFIPFILEANREWSHGSISDKRGTGKALKQRFPRAVFSPGFTEEDTFYLDFGMCQKIGIYDYEARRDAGKLTDQETAKLYEPLSVEETAYRRTLLESYGLSILEDIEQMANERYFREEEASVLNRSRQADEQMFDTLRELGVHECLLGTHGQISHVKLKDWWCNAKLTNSVREAFGPEFHHVFEGYREDGTLFGTPAYMQRAEDRPITLMVRKKDGKATNSTMANAYKDLMKSLTNTTPNNTPLTAAG